jgi:hypothetical protein
MGWGSGIRRKPIPDSGSLIRNTTTIFFNCRITRTLSTRSWTPSRSGSRSGRRRRLRRRWRRRGGRGWDRAVSTPPRSVQQHNEALRRTEGYVFRFAFIFEWLDPNFKLPVLRIRIRRIRTLCFWPSWVRFRIH